MWSGRGRHDVIREFQQELTVFGERIVKSFDQGNNRRAHEVILFGNNALCTMVNSKQYNDPDLSSEVKSVQGIDELIYCVMESLDNEKLLGWCYAVLHRRTFWEKISQQVNGFCLTQFRFLSHLTSNELILNLLKMLKKENK